MLGGRYQLSSPTAWDGSPPEVFGRGRLQMVSPKPYKFIGFGDIHSPKPYEFIGFGDIPGPNPYKSSACLVGGQLFTLVAQVVGLTASLLPFSRSL
jgi:hypothetical protein